jgi:trk system potassium uptake protein TrkA
MKIIILGAGTRGFQIAKHLIEEKKDVVLIESDPKKASYASSKLDCMVLNGSGTSIEMLEAAGIHETDMFISMTDSDEVNMVACGLVSSEFDVKHKIACIRNLTYIGLQGLSGKILGIDYIINPEAEAANEIYEIIDKGVFSDMISFQKSSLLLNNIHVTPDSEFVNKDIKTIRKAISNDFLIAAIHRRARMIVPSGDTVVRIGDTLSVITEENGIMSDFSAIGKQKKELKRVLLVGGSKTARFLLKNFSESDRKSFALVDQDGEVCKTFAEQFPELLVIQADITDETLYEDEDISNYDLMITLTENDELNILTAIYAKKIGIDKSLALIKHNNNYLRLAPHLDLDAVIAVSSSTVNSALRYIRGENF